MRAFSKFLRWIEARSSSGAGDNADAGRIVCTVFLTGQDLGSASASRNNVSGSGASRRGDEVGGPGAARWLVMRTANTAEHVRPRRSAAQQALTDAGALARRAAWQVAGAGCRGGRN